MKTLTSQPEYAIKSRNSHLQRILWKSAKLTFLLKIAFSYLKNWEFLVEIGSIGNLSNPN